MQFLNGSRNDRRMNILHLRMQMHVQVPVLTLEFSRVSIGWQFGCLSITGGHFANGFNYVVLGYTWHPMVSQGDENIVIAVLGSARTNER